MTRLLLLALLATTLGCERAGRRPIARDTAAPSHAAGRDTLAAPSIPPVPADSMTIRMSATGDSARADTALPALQTGGAESAGDSATVSI